MLKMAFSYGLDREAAPALGDYDTAELWVGFNRAKQDRNFEFFDKGDLTAIFLNAADEKIGNQILRGAVPEELATLSANVAIPAGAKSVELHLIATDGHDLGSLGKVAVTAPASDKGAK